MIHYCVLTHVTPQNQMTETTHLLTIYITIQSHSRITACIIGNSTCWTYGEPALYGRSTNCNPRRMGKGGITELWGLYIVPFPVLWETSWG